jgi:2-keto-4-pentenoate hydratase/2-oxohepta-3-ene-1,7-dioic acid hydratase in catechol pathway
MRLGTARADGGSLPVLVAGDRLEPLAVPAGTGLADLIAAGPDAIEAAVGGHGAALEGAELEAPLRPAKIICIGLNYLDHIRESNAEPPKEPLIFAKFPTAVIGPGEPIPVDGELTKRVDWEVELAVVIGRRMRNVAADRALEGVFGYTVANDVSARDLQFSDGQWVRAKSLDGFCPLGPVVLTADEVPDPQALALRTTVNGEVVQDSTTAEMVFGVAELIEFCSRSFTLEPGDVLLTGTPWGCGEFMDPPRSLHPGDEVEVSIHGIGGLRNPVVDAAG